MCPIPWAGTGLFQMSSSRELCRLPHECRVRYLVREQFPSLLRLLPVVCRIGVSHDWRHLCARPICHCRVERHAGLLLASCGPHRMFGIRATGYGLPMELSIASTGNPPSYREEKTKAPGRCRNGIRSHAGQVPNPENKGPCRSPPGGPQCASMEIGAFSSRIPWNSPACPHKPSGNRNHVI